MIAGEFEVIRRFFKPLAAGFPGALGLGDDAALLSVGVDERIVVTTDMIVEGVHFLPDDPPADIAAKLLRVNLSDLAAMGASPLAYTLTAAFPPRIDEEWLTGFASGLADDQRIFGIHLVGGDTVSTPGPLTLGVAAFGRAGADSALRRSAARPGDGLYVSGTIGDAALGLAVLQGRRKSADNGFLIGRYRRPQPRTTLGPMLVGLVKAAIDVSDGLIADLGHICEESEVSAVVEAPKVPLSEAARKIVDEDPTAMTTILTGGDDYELLFTAAPEDEPALSDLSTDLNVPVTCIGKIVAATGDSEVTVVDDAGKPIIAGRGGFRHF